MKQINMYLHTVIRQGKPTSTNYKIAEYLLRNYDNIDNLSTSLLAEKCFVSKASISRFCKSIGIEDFAELKVLAKLQGNNGEEKFYFETSTDNEAIDFLTAVVSKVEYMKAYLDENLIDQLARDIQKHKKIILMGISQSINYAYRLQQDLIYFHKFLSCVDSIHEQNEILMHADSDTLILAFSVSGTFFQKTVEYEKMMKRQDRLTIYMVSCQPVMKPDYVKDIITISNSTDYTSQIMMSVFVHLLVIRYKSLSVSQNETETTF